MERDTLRKQAKRQRDMVGEQRPQWNHQIAADIAAREEYKTAKQVLLYASFGSEVDLTELLDQAWRDGKIVYLPRCYPEERRMEFYAVDSLARCVQGAYGILEPPEDRKRRFDGGDRSLMIAPGVAYDARRYRLGYGAGYYDRFLARYPKLPVWMAAFSCQQVADTMPLSTDIPMNRVITEQGEI